MATMIDIQEVVRLNSAPKDLGTINIIIPKELSGLPETATMEIGVVYFWVIFRLTQQIGEQGIRIILEFVSLVEDSIITLFEKQLREALNIPSVPRQVAQGLCIEISRWPIPQPKPARRRRDPEVELKTQFVYGLLSHHRIGYDRAAQIANVLLEKEMNAEAWRKYFTRWAMSRGMGKPDLRSREA